MYTSTGYVTGVPNPWAMYQYSPRTRPHSRRWATGQWVKQQVYHSLSLALLPKPFPHPMPWKNCPPQNQSLVPRRLGTTSTYTGYTFKKKNDSTKQNNLTWICNWIERKGNARFWNRLSPVSPPWPGSLSSYCSLFICPNLQSGGLLFLRCYRHTRAFSMLFCMPFS